MHGSQKGKKMGGGIGVAAFLPQGIQTAGLGSLHIPAAALLFPLLSPTTHTIPQANAVSERNLLLAKAVSERRNLRR